MAKGAYSFLAYPESCDIKELCEAIQHRGGEWSYILHDKDVWLEDNPRGEEKKGDLKVAHYHIVAGWEDKFPKWKEFKELCKEVGAVALSFNSCFVLDCEGCTRYFTHPDNPEKYQYSLDEVHSSDDFDCDAYQLADKRREKQRKKAKIDKLSFFQEITSLIQVNKIDTWAKLVNRVNEQCPEYLETCMVYFHQINGYIRTFSNGCSVEELRKQCLRLESDLRSTVETNKRLSEQNRTLRQQNENLRRMIMQYSIQFDGGSRQQFWENFQDVESDFDLFDEIRNKPAEL